MWRSYNAWAAFIRRKRVLGATNTLTQFLFLGSNPLRNALHEIRYKCIQFKETRMYIVIPDKVYTLKTYIKERKQ